ncbi:MAG: hypothetical protein PVJ62_05130, partial [Deltaproteobacteria bacterium]
MRNEKSADAYKGFLEDISQFSSERAERAAAQQEGEQAGEAAPVGQRVQRIREEKGLTLEDVS